MASSRTIIARALKAARVLRNRLGSSLFCGRPQPASFPLGRRMRAVARGGGLIAFHLLAAWVARRWSPAPPAPQTAAPPVPALPRAAPAPAPPARSCPAAAPPASALVPDLCAEIAQCLPAPACPAWDVCPDPCPACPTPEEGPPSWGYELGFGLLALLVWELLSHLVAAACGLGRRLLGGVLRAPAQAPPAAALEDAPDRRVPRGRGRVRAPDEPRR